MIEGRFISLPLATLLELQTDFVACLKNISLGHQSYSIAGRAFTRANLKEVSETLAEVNYAIDLQAGNTVRTVHADMSNG